MATVTWGAPHIIPGGLIGRRSPVIKLANHRVVCFYVKAPLIGYGCIFDVDPATGLFTQYAESQFWNNVTPIVYCIWACLLDSSTLLVIYKNAGDGDKPYGKIGIITGTNIAWGAAQRIYNFDCDWIHCDTIDSTRAVMVIERADFPNEGKGEVCIIERSGNAISAIGGSQIFQADRHGGGWNLMPWVTALSPSKFVISFIDLIGFDDQHHVYYGTVVGTGINLISFSAWDSDDINFQRGIRLTDSTYCIMWNNITNTEGRIAAGTVPTTKGATVVLNPAAISDPAIGLLSDGRIMVHYHLGVSPQFRTGSVAGGVTTMDAAVPGAIANVHDMADIGLGDIVAYGDVAFDTVLVYGAIVVIPAVTTDDPIVANRVVLNGTLDDAGNQACTCGFEWGENPSMINVVTSSGNPYNTGESFLYYLNGLLAGTYYYRAWASNDAGTDYGAMKSFTVLVSASASVSTLAATLVGENSARLNGHINNSLFRYAEVRFEYGLTPKYGQQTGWQQTGFITGDSFHADITGLSEGKAYHFRAQMRINPIISGGDSSFVTGTSVGPVTWITDDLMQMVGR